eukprot:scaffold9150_cov120-Isochrysis_galbana.AAC.11
MAPRQLELELNEVDMAADKGAKRVRVDRAQTRAQCRCDCPPERPPASPPGHMPCAQQAVTDHWPEPWLLARVVSAAKTPSGVAAPPNTITAQAVHCSLQYPTEWERERGAVFSLF